MDKNLRNAGVTSLSDVMDANKRQTKYEINCAKIGIIQSFDSGTQRAEIQIAYKQVKDILEDGTRVWVEYPVLVDCPVITLFGGVDFLSMPIQSGDSCLVLFNDNEIDQWATNGTGNPETYRMHDISDGIAIVGIRPLTNSIGRYLENGIRLSHAGGNSEIDLKDDLIESVADLFLHNGDMRVTGSGTIDQNLLVKGNCTIEGTTFGNGGTWTIDSNIQQASGRSIHAGNGASGTFDVVTVVDGIVVGGS